MSTRLSIRTQSGSAWKLIEAEDPKECLRDGGGT